jgi:hypothetical protein
MLVSFFRDSTLVASPGTSYDESPSFHKIHRNNKVLPTTTEGQTKQVFDNLNIQHQIPRSDRQYSWITSSITKHGFTRSKIRGLYENWQK